jgi:hypothetical protein
MQFALRFFCSGRTQTSMEEATKKNEIHKSNKNLEEGSGSRLA